MSKPMNLIVAFMLGLTGAVGSTLALNELSRETAAPRPPFMMTFDTTEDGQARQAVNRALKTHDYTDAKRQAKSALSIAAYNNNARLRLTYIDFREHGRLTETGERYLAQSYDLAPYDAFAAPWRVKFALEHWPDLTTTTRKAVQAEAEGFLRSRSQVANMRNTLNGINNPDGRLVATLWILDVN